MNFEGCEYFGLTGPGKVFKTFKLFYFILHLMQWNPENRGQNNSV